MPTTRLSTSTFRRRRSSHLLQQASPTVKPGIYGLQSRPIAFAPNITPGTFVEPDSFASAVPPAAAVLFPPAEQQSLQSSRKRHPPGKRPSQGYIPRPPNAFMLFRADFVKQRHVPGSIETNHGSLSKIIGNCWRQLPLEEKRYWELRAKEEKQQHKIRHPDYRFRPVHNRNKTKDGSKGGNNLPGSKKEKPLQTPEEEMRCDAVAAFLLEGKKGDELAQAVRSLDMARNATYPPLSREGTVSSRASFSNMTPAPPYIANVAMHHTSGLSLRRPSSVPLPDSWVGGYGSTMFPPQAQYPLSSLALPQVPFITNPSPRPVSPSPIAGISFAAQQQQINGLYLRRPSSAQPMGMFGRRSWTTPSYEGYTVMPFLHDLGLDHQLHGLQPHGQQEQAETAGEPDYALFNGFSFNSHLPTSCSVVSSQDGSNTSNVGPHELLPSLNLSMEHVTWNGEIDPALDSASSLASSSASTTVSSLESSPVPSDTVRDMYMPTTTTSEAALFATPNHMYNIDANYDLGLTPFDISPLDHLSMQNAGFSHDSAYSYDATGMEGYMDNNQPMDPILHAPKPLLPNECTPTKVVFGDLEAEEFTLH